MMDGMWRGGEGSVAVQRGKINIPDQDHEDIRKCLSHFRTLMIWL